MVGCLSQAELESIALGPPERRWLLLEAPFAGLDRGFAAAADERRARGFGVVVAHPERSLGALAPGWRGLLARVPADCWSSSLSGGDSAPGANGLPRLGSVIPLAVAKGGIAPLV